ncbi:MAG: ABC transporter permease subunit [Myxococcota bacterium]
MGQVIRQLAVLTTATLRESIRNRLLLTTLAFAVVLVGLSVAAASVSIGEQVRLIVDVGLAAASALGSAIAIAVTVSSFAGELTHRTAYPVLVRPLSRSVFVAGKYFGLVATMMVVASLMVLSTAAIAALYGGPVPAALWASLVLTNIEMAVVVALTLLFSSFAAPALAATYAAGFVLAGNLTSDIVAMAERFGSATAEIAPLLRVSYIVLPDLARLSARTQAANGLPVAFDLLGWATLYGLGYAATAVIVAAWLFERRRSV